MGPFLLFLEFVEENKLALKFDFTYWETILVSDVAFFTDFFTRFEIHHNFLQKVSFLRLKIKESLCQEKFQGFTYCTLKFMDNFFLNIYISDIDDIYRNILLAHNIAILRHIVVLLLCIDGENSYYIVGVVLMCVKLSCIVLLLFSLYGSIYIVEHIGDNLGQI